MRLPAVLNSSQFSPAEQAALRLDGDCFALGDAVIPLDQPVDAVVRAGSIAPAAAPRDLVAERWTAAWIYGAAWRLPRPHQLCIDVLRQERTVMTGVELREVHFEPGDVIRLAGLRVSSPIRTAFDLARLERVHDEELHATLRGLLEVGGMSPQQALSELATAQRSPYKRRAAERLRALRDERSWRQSEPSTAA